MQENNGREPLRVRPVLNCSRLRLFTEAEIDVLSWVLDHAPGLDTPQRRVVSRLLSAEIEDERERRVADQREERHVGRRADDHLSAARDHLTAMAFSAGQAAHELRAGDRPGFADAVEEYVVELSAELRRRLDPAETLELRQRGETR